MSGTSAYAPRNGWAAAGSVPRGAGRLAGVRLLDLLVELPRQRAGRLVGVRQVHGR